MGKNDVVIKACDVKKDYLLYPSPGHKVRDMLGLLRNRDNIPVKNVLKGINLEVSNGEKVCIIGRNGAGKSTLLKLISGVIKPTSGSLQIKGKAKALLQIGSGFYREMTGRDNAAAYLAQQAVNEKEIPNLIDNIIEFSELEEYIDQPIKVFSSGMIARLMFATSTVVTPDLLILDEILSVGDAYFTQKCIERVKTLCDGENTTLLLVSHDIYSASKLVDRMIWLDNGKIEFDGCPKDIIPVYEDSVRIQEDQRLRKKSFIQLKKNNKSNQNTAIIEFMPANQKPLESTVYINHISIKFNDDDQITLDISNDNTIDSNSGFLDGGCWGDAVQHKGVLSRKFNNHGGCFMNARVFTTLSNKQLSCLMSETAEIDISLFADIPFEFDIAVYVNNEQLFLNTISYKNVNVYVDFILKLTKSNNVIRRMQDKCTAIGTNKICVNNIEIHDENRNALTVVQTGQPITFVIELMINDRSITRVDILLSIMKGGFETSCNYNVIDFEIQSTENKCILTVDVDSLGLGVGEYSIAVLIAKPNYTNTRNNRFYSINPDLYFCERNLFHLTVVSQYLAANNTAYLANADWKIHQLDDDTITKIEAAVE